MGCPPPGFEPRAARLLDGHSATELRGFKKVAVQKFGYINTLQCKVHRAHRTIFHSYTLIFRGKSLFLSSSVVECPSSNLGALGSNPGRGHPKMTPQKILPCRISIFSYFECLGCLLRGLKGHSHCRLFFIKIQFGVLCTK